MNRREAQQTNETLLNLYCGILFHAGSFEAGGEATFEYRFDCPEFEQLRAAYPIERVAGRGGDFERALRLCRWLAPRRPRSFAKHNCPASPDTALLRITP